MSARWCSTLLAVLIGLGPVDRPVAATPPQAGAPVVQVMAARLEIRQSPDVKAAVLAVAQRGRLLVLRGQAGDWFEVALEAPGQPAASGWVKRERVAHGEWSVQPVSAPAPPTVADAGGQQRGAVAPARRPGAHAPDLVTLPGADPTAIDGPADGLARESIPLPDRWRIMQSLGFRFPWYDPYHQNVLKGDLPIREWGDDTFLALNLVSDTLIEARRFPVPVAQVIQLPGPGLDIYGRNQFLIGAQTLVLSASLIEGNTTYKPPDTEIRFVPVLNINHVRAQEAGLLRIDPLAGKVRTDHFAGVQELFYDRHLRNVSDRYDFDSLRVGIQPFTSDFRGFLFIDQPLGIRLFGNRDNNQWQYNLAWFRRLEKDTNSGLNDLTRPPRRDDVLVANLYRQDWPRLGFTSQATILHNRNREDAFFYDNNGFLARPAFLGDLRPHRYQVTYIGASGDGHLGSWWPNARLNLTTSTYLAIGTDERHPLAQRRQRIRAAFHASELSRDFSWIRVRANLLLASGDSDPYDDVATGFDAIFENPQFAGADTSYFIRQTIPLVGGGGVALSGRNGLLPSLRSSKEQGQSNFINPGLILLGVGADLDLMPELRVTANLSHLRFMQTRVLGVLRNEDPPPREMGWDVAIGLQWRPMFIQNVVINGSVAAFRPGDGLRQFYGNDQGTLYSGLVNAVLSY